MTPPPTSAAPAAAGTARPPKQHRGSLQVRLILTVGGIVALILIVVSLAAGALLARVLDDGLNSRLQATASDVADDLQSRFPLGPDATAVDVLRQGRQPAGFLLVVRGPSGAVDGAVVTDENTVRRLTDAQLSAVVAEVGRSGPFATVSVDHLGQYRIGLLHTDAYQAIAGLPLSELRATLGQLFTTMILVTAGGLLLIAAAITIVIRAGLAPLRAVAETATRVAATPMSEGVVELTERVPAAQADERTEVGRVGHALNTLLDHVSDSLDARQRNEERMRQFVADASHELRTPLAAIRGYSELSLRAFSNGTDASPDTTHASLERIQAQSLRMTSLVEDLLTLARLDEGKEIVFGTVDLSQLAVEALGDARAAGPDHEWDLELGADPVVIAGDAARLTQVVVNLLANARIHTPAGTRVTLSVAQQGAEAVLAVHDDGPGVDPKIADALFERFARADSSRARQTGGTGLGLSIARAIVEAHGGTLTVRSEPGDTTFEMRVPARPRMPQAAASAPADTTAGQ